MCDELTAGELAAASAGVSRRSFAAMSGAAALLSAAPAFAQAPAMRLSESKVAVPTPYGVADGFFVHPATGKHPAIILWPDIAGLRDAFMVMARRLAGAGFSVLAINQYYRSSPAPVLHAFAEWRTPAGQAKIKPMVDAITPAGIMRDATALVAFLDKQPSVDRHRKIGTVGFCMGGPYTVFSAAAVPGRVGAAVSLHGGNLVNDTPDSPSKLLANSQAAFLFAIARNDDTRAPGDKDQLRAAAAQAGRKAEIEVYAADHGWTVIDAPTYDRAEAERAWGRMMALFATL